MVPNVSIPSSRSPKLSHRALRRQRRIYDAIRASCVRVPFGYVDDDGDVVGDEAPEIHRSSLAHEVLDELFHAATGPDPTLGARPVRGFMVDAKREVFLHDVVARVGQRLWVAVANAALHAEVPTTVYSYGPGRHRFAMLHHARALMRRGYVCAHKADVRDFFGSIRKPVVIEALEQRTSLDDTMIRIVRMFLASEIVRDASHPRVVSGEATTYEPPRGTLLQGSVVAPVLSNLVGAHILDIPFAARHGSGVLLLRYADDMILLGRDPRAVDDALGDVRTLLGDHGLTLHPTKTTAEVCDLRKGPIRLLGKDLCGGDVWTPRSWWEARLTEAASFPPGSSGRVSRVAAVVNELQLDPLDVFDDIEPLLRELDINTGFGDRLLRGAQGRHRLLGKYDAAMSPLVRQALAG